MAVLPDLTSSSAKYRIFISCSHGSKEHRAKVKTLADTLFVTERVQADEGGAAGVGEGLLDRHGGRIAV